LLLYNLLFPSLASTLLSPDILLSTLYQNIFNLCSSLKWEYFFFFFTKQGVKLNSNKLVNVFWAWSCHKSCSALDDYWYFCTLTEHFFLFQLSYFTNISSFIVMYSDVLFWIHLQNVIWSYCKSVLIQTVVKWTGSRNSGWKLGGWG
jgi:hypothetical protein